MRSTILLFLFIVQIPQGQSQADEQVVLNTANGDIYGTLLSPDYATDHIALIIAGSGPTDRNGNNPMMINNSLKMMAEGLADEGIASLRYDKRGIAESKMAGSSESDLRFHHFVEDAEAWITFLKNDRNYKNITIIGHSEGALIGAIAAQQDNVTKLVSLAGTGEPASQTIRKQLHGQAPILLKIAEPFIEKLERGMMVDSFPPMLNSLFRKSVQPYVISWFKYDPAAEIAKVHKPILVIQGNTDIQVPLDNAKKLAAANTQATLTIIDGMNHILKTAEIDRAKNIATYNIPDLPLTEGFLDHIISFIKEN